MTADEKPAAPLLKVDDLKVHFAAARRRPFAAAATVHAVDGISFEVARGRTLGIVGESGSGKTTAALAILRLVPITAGTIDLDGVRISALGGEALRQMRRRVQFVFQDPFSSLNPRQRAGAIVREPLDLMGIGSPAEREREVAALFRAVGLRPEQQALFPHQFSGGQRQRIGIARAIASRPDLVVCDEPVSALDVAIQAQILNLLTRLQQTLGLTYVFISHELGVVLHRCDEIAVLYLGRIVERAARASFFRRPLHPYSAALLSAIPGAGLGRMRLEGDPPSPINLPPGCRFAGRCPFAIDACRQSDPPLRAVADGHLVACHRVDDEGTPPHHAGV